MNSAIPAHLPELRRLYGRQVWHDHPVHTGVSRVVEKTLSAIPEVWVVIPQKYQRRLNTRRTQSTDNGEALPDRYPVLQSAVGRHLNRWTVSQGIAERHTQLHHVAAGVQDRPHEFLRCGYVWKSNRDVWRQGDLSRLPQPAKNGIYSICHLRSPLVKLRIHITSRSISATRF